MSDRDGSKPVPEHDVDDVVDSAKAGLADAAAARTGESVASADGAAGSAAVPDGASAATEPGDGAPGDASGAVSSAQASQERPADAPAARRPPEEDSDLAAFAAAEAAFPGTFGGTFTPPPADASTPAAPAVPAEPAAPAEPEIATTAYAPPAPAEQAETRVLPPEPLAPVTSAQLPIFVQAPEPPRPHGNRGAIAGIGLVAAIAFAVLYLGATLGFGALQGDVTAANIGTVVLDHLRSWSLWIPTAVFFVAFWLLGAVINRGRWGFWVVFGILVGALSYGGHILGALFAAPFWSQTASRNAEVIDGQLLAPLAIVAFVLGRELAVWFGAWAARSGARKNERNAEEQREYERVLEAGPQLPG
ncbi:MULTISPECIES: hypothetical protein [Bacteria]|uniref:hypothetical protein n=1 Tax=Bacteria TaxID=2 RepID=UPI003C7AF476